MSDAGLGAMVDVRGLLGPERGALVELLGGLGADEWAAPSPCPGWSVHDLAVHLVHDDLRRLSAQRDGHQGAWVEASSFDELAAGLGEANSAWVTAVAPTLSPRLTVALLEWLAEPSEAHLTGLEPDAVGDTVSWAGPGPHPNWLDVAREFTERWVHQQQIREAVGRPGLDGPEYLGAVVETFARALPAALPPRPVGTAVELRVSGGCERRWTAVASASGWALVGTVVEPAAPAAVVEMPAGTFWRRAVRMLGRQTARGAARVDGDTGLAAAVLDVRAAIVHDAS